MSSPSNPSSSKPTAALDRPSTQRWDWLAPAVATLALSLAASLRVLAQGGWPHGWGYFAWTAGLATAAALAVGGLGRRLGFQVPGMLALWCVAELLLAQGAWAWQLDGAVKVLARAAVPAALVYTVLRVTHRQRRRAKGQGTIGPWGMVGSALAVAVALFWLRSMAPGWMARWSWLRASSWGTEVVVPALVLAALTAGFLGLSRRRPGLGLGLALGLLLVPSLVPLAQAGQRPDQREAQLPRRRAAEPLPSIVVLVLDTVRGDRLSLDDSTRDTTPELAAFVARQPRATVFPRAYSTSNWTVPAHASLLTGQLPSRHGAHFAPADPTGATPARQQLAGRFALRKEIPTLAEGLRRQGFRTLGVTANPWLVWTTGLRRGFDVLFRPPPTQAVATAGEPLRRWLTPGVFPEASTAHPEAKVVADQTLRWLDACGDGPCFALANFLEPHALYAPASPCRGRFAPWSWREPVVQPAIALGQETLGHLSIRYDEELCNLDQVLGRFLEELEARQFFDHGWLVITSDHGEAFGEHGVSEHSTSVYDEEVRVPLIVVPPQGVSLPDPHKVVSLLDVAATLAAVASVDLEGPGRDLRQPTVAAGRAPIEFFGDPGKARFAGALAAEPARAVVVGHHKLIEHAGRRELYHLIDDPEERHDLAATSPRLIETLAPLLPPLHAEPLDQPPTEELTPAQRDALRALGYL